MKNGKLLKLKYFQFIRNFVILKFSYILNIHLFKIIANLIVGIFIPIILKIRWLPNIFEAVFFGKYNYYDFEINSLGEFLKEVYVRDFFLEYSLSIILILLPFQLIKDNYFLKNKRLSFFRKFQILTGILIVWIIILGSFSNVWMTPWWYNFTYLVFAVFFSLVFTTLLYFLVDRYMEKVK